MDYSLSTEQEILRESVRNFAENEIKPVARDLDEKEEFSYATMRKMADLGLFGVFVSEEYGGQSMDYVSYIIAVEEIARVDGSHAATVAAENSLGIGPLYYFGNEGG
jgi:alkylation response protein AidB-like acyl-CoA dehydrogenase